MRASTWARSRSWASSSVRPSSVATRERRSENSHDARSMTASASREVTISSSMVSSSTSASTPPRPGGGRSPGRVAETPCASTWRRPLTMPRCQACAPFCSSCSRSRRRTKTVCSQGLSISERLPSSADCTSGARFRTSSSTYSRRAWAARCEDPAAVAMWESWPFREFLTVKGLYTTAPALGSLGSWSLLVLTRSSRLTPSHMAMPAATKIDE